MCVMAYLKPDPDISYLGFCGIIILEQYWRPCYISFDPSTINSVINKNSGRVISELFFFKIFLSFA